MMKHLTISRKWNSPQIEITVNNEQISLQMDIEDFKRALISEIGPVSMIFRQSTFECVVSEAFSKVIDGVKQESSKVVNP